jgi:BASS family bile acid:Na+ symporter
MFEMVAIQTIPFMLIGFILYLLGEFNGKVVVESLMLCLICPTATAASVVVNKLDGNPNTVVSYTLVIYLITAILIPATLSICDNTYMHTTVADAFWIIIKRIFPMLTFPMIASWIVRLKMPKLHKKMVKYSNRAFYLWAICLALSIGISVNSLYKTNESISNILLIAAVSLASCIMQFYVGRKIGNKHHDSVAATQSLGQKNSALIIWIGYTFLNPVTSIAGGFYAIWQNLINTWQLYEKRKKDSKTNSNQQR